MKLNLLLVPLFVFGVHTVANSKDLTGSCLTDYRNYSVELESFLEKTSNVSIISSGAGAASMLGGATALKANVNGFGVRFMVTGVGAVAAAYGSMYTAHEIYIRNLQIHQLISESYLGDGLMVRKFKTEFKLKIPSKIPSKKITKILKKANEDRSLCTEKLMDIEDIANLVFFRSLEN